jgi:NAD-dependent SIR2 family protein deacetylase
MLVEPIDFSAFSVGFWQDFHTAMLMLERKGADVRVIRQQVEDHNRRARLDARRNNPKRKKELTEQEKIPSRLKPAKRTGDSFTHMRCPLCGQAFLRQRAVKDPITGEPFADIYCAHCRASAEFK